MIRAILIFVLLAVIYQAVKLLFRAAIQSYRHGDGSSQLPGAEMVQDPQCLTYIVKDRAVTRRISGTAVHFCSAACADKYEQKHRS